MAGSFRGLATGVVVGLLVLYIGYRFNLNGNARDDARPADSTATASTATTTTTVDKPGITARSTAAVAPTGVDAPGASNSVPSADPVSTYLVDRKDLVIRAENVRYGAATIDSIDYPYSLLMDSCGDCTTMSRVDVALGREWKRLMFTVSYQQVSGDSGAEGFYRVLRDGVPFREESIGNGTRISFDLKVQGYDRVSLEFFQQSGSGRSVLAVGNPKFFVD